MGISKFLLHLGRSEGTTLSIKSLEQGVWGVQPLRSYWVFLILVSTEIPCNPL